jgi:glycogen phosphorylase
MGYHVHPISEFLVRPALPPALARMMELSYNLLWSWDHTIRALFRRLDPQLWLSSGPNPILMLSQMSPQALERAANDPRYLALYRRACERFDSYMERHATTGHDGVTAYFCMEFGLVDCMPTYSGGLGILAGDHLKAASDLGMSLVGVGLLYQKGYFRQSLNPDGWQHESTPVNDFYTLPLLEVQKGGEDLIVTVDLPRGPVHLKVWQMNIGRVRLYLLDTNIPENEDNEYRDITDQLYGGDQHARIRQEIVLGIGGLRALKALGLEPTVYHMNEGHSAFLAVERIRLLMQDHGLAFDEALEASRSNNVFTTHTSVPAGIDLFDPGLLREFFHDYCAKAGIEFGEFLELGRRSLPDPNEPFSMAISAIKTSAYRNAVSRLHREVSQVIFHDLWPQLPAWEIPITSITNGVHLPSWLNGDLAALYDQYLQPDWLDRYIDPQTWELIGEIPDAELWEAHRRHKRRLIHFIRERVVAAGERRKASAAEIHRLREVLDPDSLTIGFSRRFATYKRATLLFRDIERLKRILTNPEMPVQIVIAGKAHPRDLPGKQLIREIWQLSRDPELSRRIVFVEDYSIQVGREIVQAVDLWLNNPRRGEEACGTSGMKAAMNGVLNLSILDGWFDEAYEISGGWAIGDRVPYSEDQDEIHASALYSMLENEIVPMFYKDRDRGIPNEWMRRMKQALTHISPQFNCQRMLREYSEQLYEPAYHAYRQLAANGFQAVRQNSAWTRTVHQAWPRIRFVETGPRLDHPALAGRPVRLHAVMDLGELSAEDVCVEAVVGRIDVEGYLRDTTVVILPPAGENGGHAVFAQEFLPHLTGRLGYAVRVRPNIPGDPLTHACRTPLKWA